MSNPISGKFNNYLSKIMNLQPDLKEGIVSFSIGILGLLFLPFFEYYLNGYWLDAIILDFIAYSFLLIGKFSYRINRYWSIGEGSIFTTNSLLMKLARICLYGFLIQVFIFNRFISFFNIMMVLFFALFLGYVSFNKYMELNTSAPFQKFYVKYENVAKLLLIVSCLAILGIMMKLYNIYSIGGWDEGWYADITYRMFQTQNWFMPLYFDDFSQSLKLFDKPPLMFILGSLGIAVFGYTTLAVKWTMGVFSGLMGIAGYLIYSHQTRDRKSRFIPELQRSEKENKEYHVNFDKDESLEKTSDGKAVGMIFGVSMAVTWFLSFYGRTAYLDPAIVAITAFTALFAVKAIDHWFYGNTRRAYIYIFLTALINMLDLLAKAWQGLIVGPSIAVYLFVRYYEYFVPRQHLHDFFLDVRSKTRYGSIFPKILAVISSIITIVAFEIFIPKMSPLNSAICTEDTANTCITFVPNFTFSIAGLTLQYWGIFLALFVYLSVVSVSQLIKENISRGFWYKQVKIENNGSFSTSKIVKYFKAYSIQIYLILIAIISGILGALIGSEAFEFLYDRLYKALTEAFQTYFTYDVMANRTFYGELIDGTLSVMFAGFIVLLVIWLVYIFTSAILDTISRLFFKARLFYNNFATKIVAEWSLVVPLTFYAIVLGYWVFFLLFKGDIFNRSSSMLMIVGVLLSILAYLGASFYVDFLKFCYNRVLKNDITNEYYQTWIKNINRLLIFLTVTSILIILSFYPFLAWIEYMDQFKVCIVSGTTACANGTYIIRLPGELQNSGIIEGTLTYTWLFFTYYVNWRYTGSGSQYSVIDSLGGLISPLFLACLPFFLTGIYALIKKRDYATLLYYSSRVFVVLITFLPAVFQLNYYYLAIFFPYFGITSYGLFWTVRKTPSSLNFKNRGEKLMLTIPVLFLIFFSIVFFPFVNNLFFLQSATNFNLFIVGIIFVVGGFIVCTVFFVRSIPEAFSLAFIIFYLYRNLIDVGIGNTDTEFLIMSAILIGIVIFLMRDRVPIGSAFFLLIIMLTAVSSTAWWANYKAQDDDMYQQIGQFILDHGGNKNKSTWVYPDPGARYAMRFYLHGLHLDDEQDYSGYPFNFNNTSTMQYYVTSRPNVDFFVVINQTYGSPGVAPTSAYTVSYTWLKSNFVLVDPLMNKVPWQRVHLFVNASVLTQADLNALNLQT